MNKRITAHVKTILTQWPNTCTNSRQPTDRIISLKTFQVDYGLATNQQIRPHEVSKYDNGRLTEHVMNAAVQNRAKSGVVGDFSRSFRPSSSLPTFSQDIFNPNRVESQDSSRWTPQGRDHHSQPSATILKKRGCLLLPQTTPRSLPLKTWNRLTHCRQARWFAASYSLAVRPRVKHLCSNP